MSASHVDQTVSLGKVLAGFAPPLLAINAFLDEPHHAPVRNPVLEELNQPAVVDGRKGSRDTLPIIGTSQNESRLSVSIILSKDGP